MYENYGMTAESFRAYNRWHWILAAILLALLLLLPWLFGIGPNSWRTCPAAMTTTAPAPALPVTPGVPPSLQVPPKPQVDAPKALPEVAKTAADPVKPAVEAPKVEAPKPASPPAAPAVVPAGDAPSAKVYFALNRYVLPADLNQTLARVTTYMRANRTATATVQGFHDPQGKVPKAYNEWLARSRAEAVQNALVRAGISAERLTLVKPSETLGSGSNNEARRVEVIVRP